MISAPGYYRRAYDPEQFQSTVKVFVETMRELVQADPEIKAIAACGVSGIPVAAAAAYVTGLALIVVRKAGEPLTHAGKQVTGYLGSGKYVIVDDLIDRGNTVRHIVSSIDEARPKLEYSTLDPVSVVLYHSCWVKTVQTVRGSGATQLLSCVSIAQACYSADVEAPVPAPVPTPPPPAPECPPWSGFGKVKVKIKNLVARR